MARTKKITETVQITFRVPVAWLAEADAVAEKLSQPGFVASRTDALRAAMARGLRALEMEQGRKR